MQNESNSSSPSIFTVITQEAIAELQADTLCLQGEFFVNSNLQQQVKGTLSSHYLALTELGWLEAPYHYYTNLDFDLKFEQMREGDNLQGAIIGFRLHRGQARPVQLRFVRETAKDLWVKWMGRLLNQLGFHRLFKPVKKLGKGGFAVVYEVQRLTDHRHFAVKAFSKQTTILAEDKSRRLALLNEITIMRAIESPHCIRLQAVFESDNSLYVVLELFSAGHLHARINRRQGKFSPGQVRQLMVGLARGLADLNALGIMHRDIKPENIMLRDDEAIKPVIADFGLASFVDQQEYLFYRCGTPGYVAPEINALKKGQKGTSLCDIFSLGAIFHVLLVRRPLFEGRRAEEVYQNNVQMRFDLNSKIYEGIDPLAIDLLRKMLWPDPNGRISAEEMLQHPFLLGQAMEEEKEVTPATTLAVSRPCQPCIAK